MELNKFILTGVIALTITSCNPVVKEEVKVAVYPEQEGFIAEDSDVFALNIADSIMVAQGGFNAWDSIRCLSFDFFGVRKLFWDRETDDFRLESSRTDLKLTMNLKTKKGRVFIHGEEQTHPDSLSKFMDVGEAIWMNDTYWLLMPFKLKDKGVTLKYIGEDDHNHVVALTYDSVGITPQNKYHIFVNHHSWLVEKWEYYANATDSVPSINNAWANYKEYEGVKLASNRGEYDLKDIILFKELSPAMQKQLFEQL